jgi:hypothetical protein
MAAEIFLSDTWIIKDHANPGKHAFPFSFNHFKQEGGFSGGAEKRNLSWRTGKNLAGKE